MKYIFLLTCAFALELTRAELNEVADPHCGEEDCSPFFIKSNVLKENFDKLPADEQFEELLLPAHPFGYEATLAQNGFQLIDMTQKMTEDIQELKNFADNYELGHASQSYKYQIRKRTAKIKKTLESYLLGSSDDFLKVRCPAEFGVHRDTRRGGEGKTSGRGAINAWHRDYVTFFGVNYSSQFFRWNPFDFHKTFWHWQTVFRNIKIGFVPDAVVNFWFHFNDEPLEDLFLAFVPKELTTPKLTADKFTFKMIHHFDDYTKEDGWATQKQGKYGQGYVSAAMRKAMKENARAYYVPGMKPSQMLMFWSGASSDHVKVPFHSAGVLVDERHEKVFPEYQRRSFELRCFVQTKDSPSIWERFKTFANPVKPIKKLTCKVDNLLTGKELLDAEFKDPKCAAGKEIESNQNCEASCQPGKKGTPVTYTCSEKGEWKIPETDIKCETPTPANQQCSTTAELNDADGKTKYHLRYLSEPDFNKDKEKAFTTSSFALFGVFGAFAFLFALN